MLNVARQQRADGKPAAVPAEAARGDWLGFASYLARKNAITGDLLAPSNAAQSKTLRDLWVLTDLTAAEFADEVANFLTLPRIDLPQLMAATPLVGDFSNRFLREMAVFPCKVGPESDAIVALADPTDSATLRAIELVIGSGFSLTVASFEDIDTVLAERLGEELAAAQANKPANLRDDDIDSLRDLASGVPVVRAVNDLIEKAIELRATDIHIEPFRQGLTIRLRIDGLLRSVPFSGEILPQALVSRIKILSGLNIAERRLPQDGAAHMHVGRDDIDIRVATMPSQHGEAAVIRLLPRDRGVLEVSKLGLSQADQATLQRVLRLPHGIVVVTGPTGSGKTTTLATMLTALNDSTRKILTIEDPIEYDLPGINQSQVKPEIGLSFSTALRSFLRHDPDVIMVGEIRDTETAHIAVHAALTGHLVLTTLHTESAASAVPRLLDLGIESFLLQSTLRTVMAQRLLRVLCERCKTERHLSSDDVSQDPRYEMLGLQTDEIIQQPRGCERCSNTGYRGRTGVFEVLEVSNEVRRLIGTRASAESISAAAVQSGMTTMFEHGVAKCRAGITAPAEVLRVTTAG